MSFLAYRVRAFILRQQMVSIFSWAKFKPLQLEDSYHTTISISIAFLKDYWKREIENLTEINAQHPLNFEGRFSDY